jgi:hypothetical protein
MKKEAKGHLRGRHGLDRGYVNKVLNGRARVKDALADALGLQRVYAAK